MRAPALLAGAAGRTGAYPKQAEIIRRNLKNLNGIRIKCCIIEIRKSHPGKDPDYVAQIESSSLIAGSIAGAAGILALEEKNLLAAMQSVNQTGQLPIPKKTRKSHG